MEKHGIYIAIEGVDGSGKSTLFNNLFLRLKDENYCFDIYCPTNVISSQSAIEKIYKKYMFLQNNSYFKAIVYAIRYHKAFSKVNWNADLILGDRSIVTCYVARWKKWFNSILLTSLFVNLFHPKIKSPNYVLYLKVAPHILKERLSGREFNIDETPKRSNSMLIAYQEIQSQNHIKRLGQIKWMKIEADKDPNILTNEAMEIIKSIMNSEKNS